MVGLVVEVATTLAIPAPVETGTYHVEVDLAREGEHWFGDDGSQTVHVVLHVDA